MQLPYDGRHCRRDDGLVQPREDEPEQQADQHERFVVFLALHHVIDPSFFIKY
ncbi:hypothetical protein D3C84_1055060 [compost metagenome]